MFRRGDYIIYPVHGIGKIVKREKVKVNEEKKEYYQIVFPQKSLRISVPVDSAKEIGIRMPLSKKELREKISSLSKPEKYREFKFDDVVTQSQKLLRTGLVKDAIEVILLINAFAKHRKEDGRHIPTSARANLTQAQDFLKQEVSYVLGEQAVITYGLK